MYNLRPQIGKRRDITRKQWKEMDRYCRRMTKVLRDNAKRMNLDYAVGESIKGLICYGRSAISITKDGAENVLHPEQR